MPSAQSKITKWVAISAASSGDNQLVAAVTGKRIRVHEFSITAAGAVTAQVRSATAGTNLTGVMSLITGMPVGRDYNEVPCFESVAGQSLNLNLGGAVQCSGWLRYSER